MTFHIEISLSLSFTHTHEKKEDNMSKRKSQLFNKNIHITLPCKLRNETKTKLNKGTFFTTRREKI